MALVERHVRLQRRGNSYVGLCPFHQEKSPSFHVVPSKKIYHCFGCSEGGDAFRFLMNLEGLSFMEAVKELAQVTGVDLPTRELTAEQRQAYREKASLYQILDAAAEFFHSNLMTQSDAHGAREYLKSRGITRATAQKWRLGYAPNGWQNLLNALGRRGFTPRQLVDAGLVKTKDQPDGSTRHYDAFRDRVMIPIADHRGRIIAFGGRLLEGDGPKYINSPETEVYKKSDVLFGLDAARATIQRRDRAMVVEGYFDVIALHEAGFPETIATCGTALTPSHMETLRRLTSQVIALFDADEAGSRAAERSLPLFMSAGLLPWRLQLPGAKDPDDLIRAEGPEAMEAAMQQVEPLLEWVLERRLSRSGGGAASRESQVAEMVELLALTEGTDIVASVARRLRVHLEPLLDRVERARRMRPQSADVPPDTPPPPEHDESPQWRPDKDFVHTLWLLVHRAEVVSPICVGVGPKIWKQDPIGATLLDRVNAGEDPASVLHDLEHPELKRTLMAVMARTELYAPDQSAKGMSQALFRQLQQQISSRLILVEQGAQRAIREKDWDTQSAYTSLILLLRRAESDLKLAIDGGAYSEFTRLADEVLSALEERT